MKISPPLRHRILTSVIIGATGFGGLLLWWGAEGPRALIAALAVVFALVILGQEVQLLADPGGEVRVAWTVAGVPLLVLRRAKLMTASEVLIERRESNESSTTYPVSLGTVPPLRLWSLDTAVRARTLATRVARELRLGLRDATEGKPRIRDREEVGLNLGQLLRGRGVQPGPLVVPQGSPVRLLPGGTELRLPARPWSTRSLFGCLGILAVPGIWMAARALDTQGGGAALIVCVYIGFIATRALVLMHWESFIRIDSEAIVTGLVGLRGRRTLFEDLQGLHAGDSGLVLLSARGRVKVPFLFQPDELGLALAFIQRAALVHRSSHPSPR